MEEIPAEAIKSKPFLSLKERPGAGWENCYCVIILVFHILLAAGAGDEGMSWRKLLTQPGPSLGSSSRIATAPGGCEQTITAGNGTESCATSPGCCSGKARSPILL